MGWHCDYRQEPTIQGVVGLFFLLALLIALFIVLLVLQLNRRLSREMSLRREAELKMKHLANHDPLTGLPNRALLDDRLEQAFLQHAREQERFAVLFLDVDGFKAINDTYGHEVGDRMLVQVTQRLAAVIRKSDTLVRFGGDEFVVILNRIQDFDAVCQVADNLIQSLAGPLKCKTSVYSCRSVSGSACIRWTATTPSNCSNGRSTHVSRQREWRQLLSQCLIVVILNARALTLVQPLVKGSKLFDTSPSESEVLW